VAHETQDNELETHRQIGKYVRYGQIIQFKHILTQRSVRMSSTEAAELDVLNMAVDLSKDNSKRRSSLAFHLRAFLDRHHLSLQIPCSRLCLASRFAPREIW